MASIEISMSYQIDNHSADFARMSACSLAAAPEMVSKGPALGIGDDSLMESA